MKHITYSKKQLIANRGRVVTIRETVEDPDCDTHIRKSFVYLVSCVGAIPKRLPSPDIRLFKNVDGSSQSEIFSLRVKGVVYYKQGRDIVKVDYLHTLKVKMLWKTHVLSSGPAALP